MKKPKDYTLLAMAIPFALAVLFNMPACYTSGNDPKLIDLHTYETDDLNFRDYEILYPDYAHNDTLVVLNADSLNWCMEFYDIASDGDISDVLRAYCVPVNDTLRNAWNFAIMPDGSIDAAILNDEMKDLVIDFYLTK